MCLADKLGFTMHVSVCRITPRLLMQNSLISIIITQFGQLHEKDAAQLDEGSPVSANVNNIMDLYIYSTS